ncbi:MAG TPA: long-chain fatty acid--CoA ligase [Mycobacteriales bacterium]|jgi:long-chain acyl-CoA synthetase|nr:long-chain fatty acid--CoA ligase [Mycobacteriales bacterium]
MASLSIASILAESAVRHAGRTAVVMGEQRITYDALWADALRYAAALRDEHGVGPGDKVGVLVPNVPDFPRTYYAVLALGAVVVPVHALLRAEEIAYVLGDSGATLLVCHEALQGEGAKGAELADVPVVAPSALAGGTATLDTYVPRDPADDAVILYTSGTTGKPKGAVLSHLNVVMNVTISAYDVIGLRADDVILGCLPLFHSFGQTCAMNSGFRAGAALVLMPRFEGPAAMDAIEAYGVTVFMGVPTMYIALLDTARTDERRPALRIAVSGGASLPVAVMDRWRETFGSEIYEGYGLSETSPVATFNHESVGRKPGTVGTPIWGVDVEIARADVEDRIELVGTGEIGEVVIRGHNVFTGYLNNDEATRNAIVDGWFRSGDLGTKDADGFVAIVDRKKDMVLRGGFNVYPREVEEVLLRHPAVGQVAVIALPDETHGEEVCAVVVRSPEGADVTEGEIVEWARGQMAAHKYPRVVRFVDAFPLGPSGKVLKRELVARFAEG